MNRMLPVIITHQVREKQIRGKKGKGIDDGAMMGGTGIIMCADMVLGSTLTMRRSARYPAPAAA